MPYKVLEEFVCVLLLDHEPGRVDYLAGILNELFPLGREVIHVDRRVVMDITQSLLDLDIGGKFSIPERLDRAV